MQPPTSSTVTMLPLRRRPLRLGVGTGTARLGSFSEGRDIEDTLIRFGFRTKEDDRSSG